LTYDTEEGRGRRRNASVSCQASFDPGMSEWGNPSQVMLGYHQLNALRTACSAANTKS
jgi:hypothetical protein